MEEIIDLHGHCVCHNLLTLTIMPKMGSYFIFCYIYHVC